MTEFAQLFDTCLAIDPTSVATIDAQLSAAPDKPAVYLLATADDQPILLASGLAARPILRRRLGEPLAEQGAEREVKLSKRADLRPLVRRLYLHVTASPFETDLWYLWLARHVFPDRYRQIIRQRHCWMIHGDPAEKIPRLTVTDKFEAPAGRWIGPMAERLSATRLVDLLTGLFGLCHYYQVLRQAPHGRPCEYKEMGRCSGPCDGTITLDEYRRQVADALDFAAGTGDVPGAGRGTGTVQAWRQRQAEEMKAAAARLDFEAAGRIKDRLARAAELAKPKYRFLGDMEQMEFLIVQPGLSKAQLRSFRSFGGRIVVGPMLTRKSPADGLADWLKLPPSADDPQLRAEEAGLLTDYLFHGDRGRGLFVRYTGQSVEELAGAVRQAFPPTVRKKSEKTVTSG